jgi:hypothetical protein
MEKDMLKERYVVLIMALFIMLVGMYRGTIVWLPLMIIGCAFWSWYVFANYK